MVVTAFKFAAAAGASNGSQGAEAAVHDDAIEPRRAGGELAVRSQTASKDS